MYREIKVSVGVMANWELFCSQGIMFAKCVVASVKLLNLALFSYTPNFKVCCILFIYYKRLSMDKTFNVIIEKDTDGFYVSSVPSLRGCHTQAKSLDELMERTKEVIELCLETENLIFEANEFIGVQRLVLSV